MSAEDIVEKSFNLFNDDDLCDKSFLEKHFETLTFFPGLRGSISPLQTNKEFEEYLHESSKKYFPEAEAVYLNIDDTFEASKRRNQHSSSNPISLIISNTGDILYMSADYKREYLPHCETSGSQYESIVHIINIIDPKDCLNILKLCSQSQRQNFTTVKMMSQEGYYVSVQLQIKAFFSSLEFYSDLLCEEEIYSKILNVHYPVFVLSLRHPISNNECFYDFNQTSSRLLTTSSNDCDPSFSDPAICTIISKSLLFQQVCPSIMTHLSWNVHDVLGQPVDYFLHPETSMLIRNLFGGFQQEDSTNKIPTVLGRVRHQENYFVWGNIEINRWANVGDKEYFECQIDLLNGPLDNINMELRLQKLFSSTRDSHISRHVDISNYAFPNTLSTPYTNLHSRRRREYKPCARTDRLCEHCGTSFSPEWRRGPGGRNSLCNACGIRFSKKIHSGRQRKMWSARYSNETEAC